MLKKELKIYSFRDLLEYFPFRYADRTRIGQIAQINGSSEYVQLQGKIISKELIGASRGRRLVCIFKDQTGIIELVWFQGISFIEKMVIPGDQYLIYGRVSAFNGQLQISHPDLEKITGDRAPISGKLEPMYSSSEKLSARGLSGKQIAKLTRTLLDMLQDHDIPEILPDRLIRDQQLVSRYQAFHDIHFPSNLAAQQQALHRLKFDELFIAQLKLNMIKAQRQHSAKGLVFSRVGDLVNRFYTEFLPFELTGAQKRVIREIRQDMGTGRQMNRLLQGDVGSGKTMVALLCMLIACDNGYQCCLMAPTEILSRQHFQSLTKLLQDLPVTIRLLTGSVKAKEKKQILSDLQEGKIDIIVGTHAIIEDSVKFAKLGLAVVDEQHRFGVAQRARLWKKSTIPPHVLVMTATPIPRTLAMTAYGDLDYSVIDELPPNRKPILTVQRHENTRSQVMTFIRSEIEKGRQAYIIFPLIEESEKLDYENLMKGYENVKAYFPEPKFWISMVHGRQPAEQKAVNMQRFKDGITHIMVATTVIEVGVDIPNASVMVIENAEKFGLSQLHQLRGRVGRGAEKSYCILLTGSSLGRDAKARLDVMVSSNDGFIIAEKDLEIRGPGDIEGTRQSGALNLKLANIVEDAALLFIAGNYASTIASTDPSLILPENNALRNYIHSLNNKSAWSKIS